ncbi:MAG: hypothetical protein OEY77_00170 [Nitrospira sp.]|nr:hypothetical protein [Nitrospira sp.]
MAAYPNIPISFEGFVELPRAFHAVRTEFESGYVQTRAKSTIAPRAFQLSHHGATAAEVTTWIAFWEARKGGAESFDFTIPRTSTTISCRFKHASGNPPSIVPIGQANVGFNIGPIMLEEAL